MVAQSIVHDIPIPLFNFCLFFLSFQKLLSQSGIHLLGVHHRLCACILSSLPLLSVWILSCCPLSEVSFPYPRWEGRMDAETHLVWSFRCSKTHAYGTPGLELIRPREPLCNMLLLLWSSKIQLSSLQTRTSSLQIVIDTEVMHRGTPKESAQTPVFPLASWFKHKLLNKRSLNPQLVSCSTH